MSLKIVAEIIANTTKSKPADIKPESNLIDLGLTSLDTITMLFELEEAFDIDIPNEAIPSIVTVGDILEKLNKVGK